MAGKPWTEERKRIVSARMTGRSLPSEWRAAIGNGNRGKVHGPEFGRKIVEARRKNQATPEQAFWLRVRKQDVGCWEWMGPRDQDSYGIPSTKKIPDDPIWRETKCHRISWRLANGPIGAGLFVCHHCDNPSCVRPDHLFLGTNRDNQLDYQKKKRLGLVL